MVSRRETRQREAKALELSARGLPLDEIAKLVGYADKSGASRAISRALDATVRMNADQLRALTNDQLDRMDADAAGLLALPGVSTETAIKVLELRRRILESRASLNGLKSKQVNVAVGPAADPSIRPNSFDGPKSFHLVIDGDAVDRRLLPWKHMVINPKPGEGTLPPPAPSVGVNPALLPAGAVRTLLAEGCLLVDGVFFSVAEEHVSDELIDALGERGGNCGGDDDGAA